MSTRMCPKARSAFTLIELLVVVAIIALLIAILLPSLGKAKEQARLSTCATRMRSWGQGFIVYANSYNNSLPNDGDSNNETTPVGRWSDLGLWFNAIPAAIGQPSYNDLQLQQPGSMPTAYASSAPHTGLVGIGNNSMYICPSVVNVVGGTSSPPDVVVNGYYQTWGYTDGYTPQQRDMLLCYGFNSQLRQLTYGKTASDPTFTPASTNANPDISKMTQLEPMSSFVIMAEKRVNPGEISFLTSTDLTNLGVKTTQNCTQTKVAPKRFAARHKEGGNLCFVDGHVEWQPFKIVNQANQAVAASTTRFPVQYNQPGLMLWSSGSN